MGTARMPIETNPNAHDPERIICDAQIHTWEAEKPEDPWPSGRQAKPHRADPLTGAEALAVMDEAGVDRAILVPPSWVGERNGDACADAQKYPSRFRVMGRFDVEQECDPEVVRTWREQPGMLGMRLTFHDPRHRQLLEDRSLDWLWCLLEECSLPAMVFAPDGSASHLGDVADRFPGVRLILDHMSLGRADKDEAIKPVIDGILPLARFPNIAVKASALPCNVTERYPFPLLQTQVRRVIDAFGVDRVMWGSDLSRLTCPYGEWLSLFTDDLGFITDDERAWLLGRTLIQWLGWDASELSKAAPALRVR
jgi:L-fuconolactonase